jgi:hypothetical protein
MSGRIVVTAPDGTVAEGGRVRLDPDIGALGPDATSEVTWAGSIRRAAVAVWKTPASNWRATPRWAWANWAIMSPPLPSPAACAWKMCAHA